MATVSFLKQKEETRKEGRYSDLLIAIKPVIATEYFFLQFREDKKWGIQNMLKSEC